MLQRSLLCVAAVVAMAGPAAADWKTNLEFVSTPGRTGVRVLSTRGELQLSFAGRNTTTPFVESGKPYEAYVPVEIRDSAGHVYKTKLELRRGYETKLTLGWQDRIVARPVPVSKPRRIGRFENTTQHCAANARGAVRFEVMAGNRVVLNRTLNAGTSANNLELEDGTYSVRTFTSQGNQLVYNNTANLAVSRDGWTHTFGCAPPRPQLGTIQMCNPSGAWSQAVTDLWVDGKRIKFSGNSVQLSLMPGTHTAEVKRAGVSPLPVSTKFQVNNTPGWRLKVFCK